MECCEEGGRNAERIDLGGSLGRRAGGRDNQDDVGGPLSSCL